MVVVVAVRMAGRVPKQEQSGVPSSGAALGAGQGWGA